MTQQSREYRRYALAKKLFYDASFNEENPRNIDIRGIVETVDEFLTELELAESRQDEPEETAVETQPQELFSKRVRDELRVRPLTEKDSSLYLKVEVERLREVNEGLLRVNKKLRKQIKELESVKFNLEQQRSSAVREAETLKKANEYLLSQGDKKDFSTEKHYRYIVRDNSAKENTANEQSKEQFKEQYYIYPVG